MASLPGKAATTSVRSNRLRSAPSFSSMPLSADSTTLDAMVLCRWIDADIAESPVFRQQAELVGAGAGCDIRITGAAHADIPSVYRRVPVGYNKRGEIAGQAGVDQESHVSSANRNVVPIADKLIGERDRRADVLLGDAVSVGNALRTVAGSQAPQDGPYQHAGARDDRLAVAAIGIHLDSVRNHVGHDFTSIGNCISTRQVGKTGLVPLFLLLHLPEVRRQGRTAAKGYSRG